MVLNPEQADAIAAAGVPTVYVDSLPFLWGPQDAFPKVTYYLAQRLPGVRPSPALEAVGSLQWVNGIRLFATWKKRQSNPVRPS